MSNNSNPNNPQAELMPVGQNVQALPTPPVAKPESSNGGNPAELGAASCSASFSSENLALPRFELQVPNYNNEGQPIKLKMSLPEIQVMIDQMDFQIYGEKYDPILAQAIS